MKKLLSVIIASILLLSTLPLSAFAENEDLPVAPPPPAQDMANYPGEGQPDPVSLQYDEEYKKALEQIQKGSEEQPKEPEEPEEPVIPEDIWDGEYKDFPAKDGTTTRVFDNGSIYTTYPDGSKEGMDYKGNRFTKDADGKTVVYTTDGDQMIKNADGSEEAITVGGTHIYYNEDGSFRSVTATGTVFEHDADDNIVAVSIEGGERLELTDENGNFITGEHVITGPDGKKFTFVNNSGDDFTQFKMWSEGNGTQFGVDGKTDENGYRATMLTADGTKVNMSETEITNEDGSTVGTTLMEIINTKTGFTVKADGTVKTDKDGNTTTSGKASSSEEGDLFSMEVTTNKNGEVTSAAATFKTDDGETVNLVANEDQISITSSNGFFIRTNPKTGAAEVFDPETGNHIKINDQGEVEVLIINGDDGSKIEQKDGRFVITDPNGEEKTITIEKDPDTGETTVTTSDGDTYTITGDGKVLKNGKELKEEEPQEGKDKDGGKWVEPYSYFGVDNIVELYPLLRSEKVQKIEVTPVAYDNNGAGQVDLITGGEAFVIDLTAGAVTTYTASYADHPRYGSQPSTYDLTLTFTANGSRDLFRVDSTHTENKHWGDSVTETDEECIIYYEFLSALRDYELRAITIDNHTPTTVIFNVDRVLLP